MNYSPAVLPELTVNQSFMVELVTADTPCFAIGLVEEGGIEYGFLGFRPDELQKYLEVTDAQVRGAVSSLSMISHLGKPNYNDIDNPYEAIPVRRSHLGG